MNRSWTRATAAAWVLALTGGTALTAARPASAAPVPVTFSYGAAANGVINAGPRAGASTLGRPVVSLSHLSIPHLVTGGNVLDTAFPAGASSSVASVSVLGSRPVSGGLTARLVHTSCTTNGDRAAASTTIAGGQQGLPGLGDVVDPDPAPNEEIDLPGGGVVILNQQVTNADVLTAAGMFIELPNGEDITVAAVSCPGTSDVDP